MPETSINIFWLLMGGAGASILGFGCTITWELWRERRQRIKKEKRFRRAILLELQENLSLSTENHAKLEDSLDAIKEQKLSLVTPQYLNTNCWLSILISGETTFVEDEEHYHLSRLYSTIQSFNNELKSRGEFWANNRALSSFTKELKIRDELLLAGTNFVSEKTNEIIPKLKV